MQITKGQLIDILNGLNDDPQLLAKIVVDTMKRLPDAYRWNLAQQFYMDYYWDGPVITVTNNLTGVKRKFGTIADITHYLKSLGYKCSSSSVSQAIRGHSNSYCNHTFESNEEKEITYFE